MAGKDGAQQTRSATFTSLSLSHDNEYGYDKSGNTSGTSLQCRGKETEEDEIHYEINW
ncbi:hypothetical protein D3C75_1355020 [compost metagenome]